jgi:hypothetical protein
MRTTSNNKYKLFSTITSFFFPSFNILTIAFIFLLAYCLLINTWSLKLIWPITTSLCRDTTTWKDFTSSLWMNIINFIFRLFHIINLPSLVISTPPCSPCIPFTDCVNSFGDYDHTFVDCTDFLSIVSINMMIVQKPLMTKWILLLI